MTDEVRMVGNVFRGCTLHVAPAKGVMIKGDVIRNGDIPRDSGDPEVDPSAGEDRAE